MTSVPNIVLYAKQLVSKPGSSITGELYIEGLPFKQISGLARKKIPVGDCFKLVLNVFDFDLDASPEMPYEARRARFVSALDNLATLLGKSLSDLPIRVCGGVICHTADEAEAVYGLIMERLPTAEGAVAHSMAKPFQPGTRRWDTQKLKPEPTIDLKVVSFEEAVDKFGMPMDCVGRINCEYNKMVGGKLVTSIIGVGPGSLTLTQRRKLWVKFKEKKFVPCLAEVKYMRDDTYDALRQATFVRWRDDKSEPDTA
jgi:ATP-dependent DNA ligase